MFDLLSRETIMEAWTFLRTENNKIPNETLDFMRDTSLKALKKKEGIERALEIKEELFSIANSYSGEETGEAAMLLHEACNNILKAKDVLEFQKEEE